MVVMGMGMVMVVVRVTNIERVIIDAIDVIVVANA